MNLDLPELRLGDRRKPSPALSTKPWLCRWRPIDNFINHDMAAPNRNAAANCNYRYLPCAGKTPAMS